MSRRNARKQPQPGQHPRSLAREGLDVAHELVAALLLQVTADLLDALRRLSRDPRRAAVPSLLRSSPLRRSASASERTCAPACVERRSN